MPPSLSVCLLTRDERFNMARVLRSVAELADQIVVADTDSTDGTDVVARKEGATVFSFTWDDDFAAGRNFALEHATGDWILWLNPDEELVPESVGAVREAMSCAEALAHVVTIQNLRQPDRLDLFSETSDTRLFRRHPEIRFVGRVHPQFREPLAFLAARNGKLVLQSAIALRHFAYLSVPTEPKLRWAARLLKRELEDRPGYMPAMIHYGKTLLLLNDPAGHVVLAEATDRLLSHREDPRPPFAEAHVLLEYLMTVAPEQLRRDVSRENAWHLAERWFPNSAPLMWIRASQLFQRQLYDKAAEMLEMLVRMGATQTYDRGHPFDPNVVGADALMNLGACYTALRRWDGAANCYRQLVSSPSHGARAVQALENVQHLSQGGGGPTIA